MAVEKMVLLKVMGTLDNINPILREIILCENFNINVGNTNDYNEYLTAHEYEPEIIGSLVNNKIDPDNIHKICSENLKVVEELSQNLGLELQIDKKYISDDYSMEQAKTDLSVIQLSILGREEEIKLKEKQVSELLDLREKVDGIFDKDMDLRKISDLNFFDYELGTFSVANKSRLKNNYQTLSAILLKAGNVKNSSEDLYMIIYPKQYKEEIDNLLNSLNWNQLTIPREYTGSPAENLKQIDAKIESLQKENEGLNNSIDDLKEENKETLLRIYNTFKLEDKIAELEQIAIFDNNAFSVDLWVKDANKENLEKVISKVTKNYRILTKETNDYDDIAMLL